VLSEDFYRLRFCEACGSFRRTLESGKALALRERLAGLLKFRAAFCKGQERVAAGGINQSNSILDINLARHVLLN
jgi:hypothetical protein